MKRGIELFLPNTPDDVRRRRRIFLAVWILTGLMVIWPLFPWIGARQTLIFGLPSSIAWVILALAIQFVALLWLYRSEAENSEPREDD